MSTPKDAWNPAQYQKFQAERSAPFFDLLNLVESSSFETVIDLGCGSGELTKALHRHVSAAKTLGLDSSAAMLAKSKPHAGGGLSFAQGDINIFAANAEYDLIFSNAAIQWCDSHERLLKNFFEALKPRGQLAIQLPSNHGYPTHTVATKLAEEAPYQRLVRQRPRNIVLPLEIYAQMLFKLGFEKQLVMEKVYPHVLSSRSDVIEWVKGTLLTHYQSQLDEQTFSRFLEDYKKRLFAVLPDDTPFFYPFKRVFLWARKP